MSRSADLTPGEERMIADILRAPLPPARPDVDASALWTCGRRARRLAIEAKISLVVTAAQAGALMAIVVVLCSFVDWHDAWIAGVDAIRTEPLLAVCSAAVCAAMSGWLLSARRT